MKRIIVDYKRLNHRLLNLLLDKYPDGYNYNDIMSFQTGSGETINALEIKTADTIYLIRIGAKLDKMLEDYSDEILDNDVILNGFKDFVDF
jgi:hypothetical protein